MLTTPRLKKLSPFRYSSFLLVVLCLFLGISSYFPATADPLPQSELQALGEYPNWVATSCGGSQGSVDQQTSADPDGASFPNLDPISMANAIDRFIHEQNPSGELNNLGSIIVASAQNADVNPFLIVSIAKEESNLGDPSVYNVSQGSNSFGRTATNSQPHFQGSGGTWYKWTSVKASVDYTAPENINAVGGGDIASYLRDQYGSAIDNNNLFTIINEYAPSSQNMTTQYISNVQGWVQTMVNYTGTSDASPAAVSNNNCSCTTASTTLVGNDNQEKIFNYFIGKGLSPAQSAGIDGNFGQESGWNPNDPGGYLAQWNGSRLAALQAYAQKENQPVTSLGLQLDYVWLELTNGPGAGADESQALTDLKATTTAAAAATVFSNDYENPGDPQLQNRIDYANQILQQYGGSDSGTGGTASSCTGIVQCNGSSPSTTSDLSQVRQEVVCIAQEELSLWNNGSMKPGFRANDSSSFSKYTTNLDEYWCADFVSWVYDQAGYPLQSDPNWLVPGVQSVQAIGEQNANFHWHPAGSYTPKPGDIVVHLSGEAHVNIVVSVSGNTMTLVGGDQNADSAGYPDGSKVSEYTDNGFSGVDGITGYVTPD
ncbi:MAG TPA: phage tail tip lysozyme [Candidatus Sulfotelmatobacter sp.]|nr:phage tail tip lysozyme [Candidatus Sulfotelmatobacter sp.]